MTNPSSTGPDASTAFAPTEHQQLLQLLWEDVVVTKAHTEDSLPQSDRRQFLRSMFAAVEAAIWVFKQEAVDQHANGAVIFEPSELILLSEKSPVLDSDGALREAPLAIRFAPNVIFAFKCHARAHNYLPVLDVGDYRWDLLKRSSQVRNRLMHPKGLASLQVSDQEISDARRSLSWFLKTSSLALLEASGWFAFQSAAKIPDSQRSVEVQRLLKEKIDELRLTIESSL